MATNRIYSIIENQGSTMVPIDKISNHIRRNNDNTKHIVEWIDEDIPLQFQIMTHAEMVTEINKLEWQYPDEDE